MSGSFAFSPNDRGRAEVCLLLYFSEILISTHILHDSCSYRARSTEKVRDISWFKEIFIDSGGGKACCLTSFFFLYFVLFIHNDTKKNLFILQ